MMFNKILVIVDGHVNIHNYEEVAHAISDNVDPASDIYFSQGPMDVLDHACSKFAFGGKMCLDATLKPQVPSSKFQAPKEIQTAELQKQFPEIKGINDSLCKIGISVLFISVEKSRKNHIKELNEKLFSREEFKYIRFVIYAEHTVDVADIKDSMWRFANNFDPKRDNYPVSPLTGGLGGAIGLDGTRKTKAFDNFNRPWPNIICADEATIKSVDAKWERMFPTSHIPHLTSPSLKYKKMLYKGGAVAEE
jgi:4-hydroxy-3-polyprenylbenzoate decarboxylase